MPTMTSPRPIVGVWPSPPCEESANLRHDEPITLLHVTDMQFGQHHRFPSTPEADEPGEDTLFERLYDDLLGLAREEKLEPQVIVVSGDLTECGLKSEFKSAFAFLDRLSSSLAVPRRHVVVVPGNHDVNRKLCAAYFNECDGEEQQPIAPYPRKWEPFRTFFEEFYANEADIEFTVEQPWSLWRLDELGLVVAGLNSTLRESHRDEDHYGWVGERQARWFAEELRPYRARGSLRIGVVHHNIRRGATADDENLRDADMFARRLGGALNVVLHGHTHEAATGWLHQRLPVMSTGSAGLSLEARPAEVPNQYQVIRIHTNRVERWARRYRPGSGSWEGDTGCSADGNAWHVEDQVDLDVTREFAVPDAPGRDRAPSLPTASTIGGEGFLARVSEVCELRHGGEGRRVTVQRMREDARHEYLRVSVAEDDLVRIFPVGVVESGISEQRTRRFCEAVFEPYYWSLDRSVRCEIVYGGERASDELIEWAAARSVLLRSFVELQGIIDFRGYVDRQTARLATDVVYPPGLYVSQRMVHEVGSERLTTDDALAELTNWMREPRARFVLVLGDFGVGKTFLLRELARRMPSSIPHLVPVLVELRSLEKAHTLEHLVAQHLAVAGERYIDLAAFPYMLREGRIALLFDGFDELAQRVTYQRATEHFETLIQAAGGNAKVVVTSRTQHFESVHQVRTALLDRAEVLPSLSLCRLQPFNDAQIRSFLKRRLGDDSEARERYALIDEIKDLLGLSHNPRMLGFIAALPAQQLRDAQTRTGTITSAELYRLLIGQWLAYETEKISPRGAAPTLSKEQRLEAVTALALRLWAKLERTIHVSELTAEVSAAATRLSVEPDVGGPFDRDSVVHLVGSRTLLVRDDDGAFAFVHQSVMEWLVADHAARRLLAGRDPEALDQRLMTKLMTDFFCDRAGLEAARGWARAAIERTHRSPARTNALLVLLRLGERLSGASLAGQQLSGHDFSGSDLHEANLAGADLTEARLGASDLGKANLQGATLTHADLSRAVLTGATLDDVQADGASLLGADLRSASLRGASLRYAKLIGARMDEGALPACDTFGAALPGMAAAEPTLASASSPCRAVAAHPRGDLLASGHADGSVRIWDPLTGRELRALCGHGGQVETVAFSPDGAMLASGGADNIIRLWDISGSRESVAISGHAGAVRALAFAPDGTFLASSSEDATVRLWSPGGTRELRMIDAGQGWVSALAVSPDGSMLASGGGHGDVRLWQTATGAMTRVLTGHRAWVSGLSFGADGAAFASASDDGSVRIWDPASLIEVHIVAAHARGTRAVAFSPDGSTLATGGSDGAVSLWDRGSGRQLRSFHGHESGVTSVAFVPDGTSLASADGEGVIRMWDATTGREIRTFTGHHRWVRAIAFSADGESIASANNDGTVRMWSGATGRELRTLSGHRGRARAVAFSSGRLLASSGDDGTVRVWDASSGDELRALAVESLWVGSVAFSPDGETLASGDRDGDIHVWNVVTGKKRRIGRHARAVRAVAFSPDGRLLATAGDDHSVQVFDVANGRDVDVVAKHDRSVRAIAFSPDGDILASAGNDHTIRVSPIAPNRHPYTIKAHAASVGAIAFSADGMMLASADDEGILRLSDPATGDLLRILAGHRGGIGGLAFAPNASRLASAGEDGTIRLWDPAAGSLLATLVGTAEGWISHTPNGRYKIAGRIGLNTFWYAIGLCRFAPGELDLFVPTGTLTSVEFDEPL